MTKLIQKLIGSDFAKPVFLLIFFAGSLILVSNVIAVGSKPSKIIFSEGIEASSIFFVESSMMRPFAGFNSARSGNWDDPLTWVGGVVPGPGDDVSISSGTIVTLDTDRTVHNFFINGPPSGGFQLNGHQLNIAGEGATVALLGEISNSNPNSGSVNFVGNGTMGAVNQYLFPYGRCSASNACNTQFRLVNGITLTTLAANGRGEPGIQNIGLSIDSSSVLDLSSNLNIDSFQSSVQINNSGTIRNGRLRTGRLSTALPIRVNNDGVFDTELIINGSTDVRGDFRRRIAFETNGGTLRLIGDTSLHADFILQSPGLLDLNGNSFHFLGNNSIFLGSGDIITSNGIPSTIFFEGNGTPGGVNQVLRIGRFESSPGSIGVTERLTGNVNVVLDGVTTMANVVVENGSTLDLNGQRLVLDGPGFPLVSNGNLLTTNATIELKGSAHQSLQPPTSGISLNNLIINNPAGVDIPNPGANILTIVGSLTLGAGVFSANGNLNLGNGATIDRGGGSLATSPNFGSSVNIRYSGFTPISSGAELPTSNIVNNFNDETRALVSLNSNVTVNGDFIVLQEALLAGAPNTTLILKGPVVANNGIVSHPSVVFDRSSLQTYESPGGRWTGASLSMVGTGGVSMLNGGNFSNDTFTNMSTINTGSSRMSLLNGAFINRGVINGNVQTIIGNVTLDAGNTGFNATLQVFNQVLSAKGRLNSTLSVETPTSSVQVNSSDVLTVTGDITINGPLKGDGTVRANGTNVSNSAVVSVANFQFGGSNQNLTGSASFSGTTVQILGGSTTTLGINNKQMASIQIDAGGQFNFPNRTLFLSGAPNPFTNAGNFNGSNSTIEFNGTSPQTLSPSVQTYFNLNANNNAGITGFSDLKVTGLLRLRSGPLTTGGTFKDVLIENGSTLAGIQGTNVLVSGNWANNGNFIPNLNTVNFNGAGNQSVVGSTATNFDNLTASGTSALNLGQNVFVNRLLSLGTDINTGSNVLTMPSTGASAGIGDVVGSVKRVGFSSNVGAYSFGNPSNSIAFFGGGNVPNEITFVLTKSTPFGLPGAIQRSYDITQMGGAGFTATLRLHYLDSELNGNNESNLKLYRFNGNWVRQGASARDTANNWVELANVTQFSPWTLFSSVNSQVTADFDGDGRSDVSAWRESNGIWFVTPSSGSTFTPFQFGQPGDKIVPGDYDGDGKADLALYRPEGGLWYLQQSSAGFSVTQWGVSTDVPVSGDFDGDGKADIAVWRPSTGVWFVRNSGNGQTVAVQYGQDGDRLVPGDYDGDGKTDLAVWRQASGIWFIRKSSGGETAVQFGQPTDKVVPADYDGDGKTDLAVYREGNLSLWYIFPSTASAYTVTQWGTTDDVPVPGDYDGDGKADISVWRPSNGIWFMQRSTSGFLGTQFGQVGDRPVPAAYLQAQ